MSAHSVRGPLRKLDADSPPQTNALEFVTQCRERLHHSTARTFLTASQGNTKQLYDRKAVLHSFQPADRVLVLVPTSGPALSANFTGP